MNEHKMYKNVLNPEIECINMLYIRQNRKFLIFIRQKQAFMEEKAGIYGRENLIDKVK